MAAKHFRDERLSMKGIPPKLRGITDDYLESKGIDLKVAPISILDQDFEAQVGKRTRNKTKAAEVEHAIRHHLDVDLDDDPDPQAGFGMSADDKIGCLVDLTQKAYLAVERELRLTGFWESIPARNKLKADLQKILLGPEFSKIPHIIKNRAHIISRIMEIAEKNNDTILYAD